MEPVGVTMMAIFFLVVLGAAIGVFTHATYEQFGGWGVGILWVGLGWFLVAVALINHG